MKPLLKCLTFMLLLPNLLVGQNKSTAQTKPNVDFTFPSWTIDKIIPVKHDSLSSIRIKNINTLLYKVTINGEQVINQTPTPAIFGTLFRIEDPGKAAAEASEGAGESKKAAEEMQSESDKTVAGAASHKIMTNLVTSCKTYLEAADKILFLKSRRAELTGLARFPWNDYNSLKSHLPAPLAYTEMTSAIDNFHKAYGKAEAQYEDAKTAIKDTAMRKKVENALELFEEAYEKINEKELLKLADDITALQNVLGNDAFLTAWGPPVQADDCDFIRYKIVVEGPKDRNEFVPAANFQPMSVDIPVKGGWKPDFSVGLNFSFGNGSRDGKYQFDPAANGQSKVVKADNNNFVRPGIATMLHAYPRTGRNYAVGFLLGLGAGFEEANTLSASYYVGASLILGKNQRMIINSGLGMLAIDRLKGNFKEGNSYEVDPEDLPELTEKTLRPTFFIGISYNITNRTIRK